MEREKDADQEVVVTIRVRVYGKRSQVRREVLTALGLGCHSAFGDRFTMVGDYGVVEFDPDAKVGDQIREGASK